MRLEKKPEAPHVVRKATFSLTLPRRPTTLFTPSKQEKTALFLFLFLHPFSRSLSPGGKKTSLPPQKWFPPRPSSAPGRSSTAGRSSCPPAASARRCSKTTATSSSTSTRRTSGRGASKLIASLFCFGDGHALDKEREREMERKSARGEGQGEKGPGERTDERKAHEQGWNGKKSWDSFQKTATRTWAPRSPRCPKPPAAPWSRRRTAIW